MAFSAPSPPPAPDPVAVANVQGQVNADTARLTQRMNLIDEVGPQGTIRYRRIGPDGTGTGVTVQGTGNDAVLTGANGATLNRQGFNSAAYLTANPDVQDYYNHHQGGAFGPNGQTFANADDYAWNHYVTSGQREGRTWQGAPTLGTGVATSPRINIGGINWSTPLTNGVIDQYAGLQGGKGAWDGIRRQAGYSGEFGGGGFEDWLRGQSYEGQVNYANSLIQAGADPDYVRQVINQIPTTEGGSAYSTSNADRWERVTEMTPQQQALYNQQQQLYGQLASLAQGQATRVGEALQTPLSLSGLPELRASAFGQASVGGNPALANGRVDDYAGLGGRDAWDGIRREAGYQGAFGGGAFDSWLAQQPAETRQRYVRSLQQAGADPDYLMALGVQPEPMGDLETQRAKTEQALYGRMEPQMARQRAALETKLANQGIAAGSEAWRTAMDDLGRQENDLRLGVTAQGGAELARLFGLQLSDAQLANAARSQALQERAYVTNTPINQITALMSGSQVQLPQATIAPPQVNIQSADYQGQVNSNYQQQMAAHNAAVQANAQTMGSLFGLGGSLGGAMLLSDRRHKTAIRRVGRLDNGLPVYSFRYRGGGPVRIGVMAQDVERVAPHAVAEIAGVKYVDHAAAAEAGHGR